MPEFSKILIANRGEIAERVIRSAKSLGYRTVAVYSEADSNARHVVEADEAVCIGKSPVGESYLLAENILHAAKLTGANAIHPGYGFLSENADFARRCQEAGLTFIGPPAEAIELMGSKRLSKIAMIAAGVPCIPGYEGEAQDEAQLIIEAKRIDFPLMIKASAGGGGRGMRLVYSEQNLVADLRSARSEATSAFGDGELILERAVIDPRHIEIQVFADSYGHVISLGERDCSIQRRHQKVVEEAPSPAVDESLRKRMGEAAVNAAKSCGYVGAGTVEFLLDQKGNFYFLEMNTRLQVEHPVTELVTGVDLVAWQIKVASGDVLPLTQDEVTIKGHAIEVRLYAEDPAKNFVPQTGKVLYWDTQCCDGIRIDHGVAVGHDISPFYDPMLAKIIAFGDTREEAYRRLINAVEDTVLLGVNTNKRFLANVLNHSVFKEGQATTAFIDKQFSEDASLKPSDPSLFNLAMATVLFYIHTGSTNAHNPDLISWRNSNPSAWPYKICCDDKQFDLDLVVETHKKNTQYNVCYKDQSLSLSVIAIDKNHCIYICDGIRREINYVLDNECLYLNTEFGNCCLENVTHLPADTQAAGGSDSVKASMDGVIVEVLVKAGESVEEGDVVVLLEAMKMEHRLKAQVSGVVAEVTVSQGQQVKGQQLLIRFETEVQEV